LLARVGYLGEHWFANVLGDVLRHEVALAREIDAGLKQRRPVPGGVALVQLAEAGDGSRRHYRGVDPQSPVVVEQREAPQVREALDVVHPHVWSHPGADARPEPYVLERTRARLVHGRRAPTAHTAHEGVGHHLHEPCRDGGVEGVTAILHDLGTQLYRRRLRRNYYPSQLITPLASLSQRSAGGVMRPRPAP